MTNATTTTIKTTDITASLAAILNQSNTAKLKDSKTELASLDSMLTGYTLDSIKEAYQATTKAGTKALFSSNMVKLIKAIKSLSEDTTEQTDKLDTLELDTLANTIRTELEQAQKSFLTVGKCLTEGLELIKASKGKQADFLLWASDTCEIKKAQAYKLMKVYKDFGDSSDFKGVSMRVLYTLTGQPTNVIEDAKALALAGKLDSSSLDKLMMKDKPAKKEKTEEVKAPEGGTIAKTGDKVEATREATREDKAKDKEIKALKRELETIKDTGVVETDQSPLIKELQTTIARLNDTIDTLKDDLADTKVPVVQALPYLPQFDSKDMATCLGLEIYNKSDKVKINKAYRSLAKIYTGTTCPEASKALLTARNELIGDIA